MDEFLGIHGLPKPNQDEINNLYSSITSNEIEAIFKINSQPSKKAQNQMDLVQNSTEIG